MISLPLSLDVSKLPSTATSSTYTSLKVMHCLFVMQSVSFLDLEHGWKLIERQFPLRMNSRITFFLDLNKELQIGQCKTSKTLNLVGFEGCGLSSALKHA